MKRTLSIVLAAIMILSALALTACGGGGSEDLSDSKKPAILILTVF